MDAFLVHDNEIRVILMTKCENSPKIMLGYGSGQTSSLKLRLLQACPVSHLPKCTMAGKFGIAKGFNLRSIMKVLNGKEPLQVFRKHQPNVKILLNLIDSRIKKAEKPKNNLTVCSPPVVHLADWTLLPKYFEAGLESQRDVSNINISIFFAFIVVISQSWIEHGATMFYIYHHSMSKEFNAFLKIYENDLTISVKRVHWSVLPVSNEIPGSSNPNNFIMRNEVHSLFCIIRLTLFSFYFLSWKCQILAWNDCVLRSRGRTRYLALADFDENFVVFTNQTLLSIIDDVLKEKPTVGCFMFLNSFASFQVFFYEQLHKLPAHYFQGW
ncbi:unnamed protein product [Enterobius vermicularis]|uniref:Glycosyltransferase family 92 protein n=1 Tax=Enterobius vermicularis TaxID=51028 RepID=A0A0N4VDE8_ENTVE|nr:unnamed protein product [Enterobius vermicularis]